MNKNNKSVLFWVVFATAMALKFGYDKFKYYPVLDDWLQYGAYQLYKNPIQIFFNYSYHTRPLASFFDVAVWGTFWPDLSVPFIVITVLHLGSCYLLYRIFTNVSIPLGIPAALIFGLMPLGNEATYWLSASTRLVVGLFFMLFSLYLLTESMNKKEKKMYIFGFWFFQLVSFCFYEQIIALGFVASLLLLLWKKKQFKKWHVFALPVLNAALIAGYYILFKAGGNAAQRGNLIGKDPFWLHVAGVFHQFYDIAYTVHSDYYTRAFPSAIRMLIETKSYTYILTIVAVSVGVGYAAWKLERSKEGSKKIGIRLLIGLIAAVVPLIPFFLIQDTGLALRNVFPSMVGLAVMVDALLDWFGSGTAARAIYGALSAFLTFVFILAGVADIQDYKRVSQMDRSVAEQIVKVGSQQHKFNGVYPAYLFGAEERLVPVNVFFLNHIRNVTGSDWALSGSVRAVGHNPNYPVITPVSATDDLIVPEKDLRNGLLMGLQSQRGKMSVVPLHAEKKDNGDYRLLRMDGTQFGVYYVKAQHFKWK
ncbi:hypothetical protein PP175_02875 [Aneurinibacillus sp. Ricciae_BoGa-3]|uniref:hypothetical protein n=1 Tax=Aneurinibacillus sp. Ricciae_BoGa-3 TaxID=3022697 RepID=UPI002341CB78|nr:hypothetical protein [Aneurinibacillus sp. Ricciae_BoGa-3]WCK54975.1 hypothetical protein PP175_02875 [Aneurinibacillus sp. Ricciae_BoGa-3]